MARDLHLIVISALTMDPGPKVFVPRPEKGDRKREDKGYKDNKEMKTVAKDEEMLLLMMVFCIVLYSLAGKNVSVC